MGMKQVSCTHKLIGLFLMCLCLAPLGWSYDSGLAEDDLQALVDEAARMNITRPARDTLDYLESIQDHLGGASPRQLAQLELIRARSHALLGNHDGALEMLEALLTGELDHDHRLRALGLSANLAMHVDRFEDGFAYLMQGLTIQEHVDDPALKSDLFGQAAFWHSQLGDPDKGLEYGFRTLELARESGDIREVCVALEKLGQAKQELGKYEQAMATYQSGLEACEEAEDPVFSAALHTLMGRLLMAKGRLEEAEPWIQRGIEMYNRSGYKAGLKGSMVDLARLRLDQEDHDKAHALLHEVLENTRSDAYLKEHVDAYYMLAQISRHRGDYQKAFRHLSEYLEARDAVLSLERARLIAFNEVQFDLQSRDQEIQLLREQARVVTLQEETRSQQRRFELIAYGMGALIVLLLLLLLLRTLRQRHYFRHLSAHDGLTGLLNHTHFIESAKSLAEREAERGQSVILVLADIDHFKQFNDHHGHQAGDEVLKKAARQFSKVLSPHGIVGRIGGEEFAGFLPSMNMAGVTDLVDQVRDNLRDCRVANIEETITMSFGAAESRPFQNFDSLRSRADSALYRAKHAGRDRLITDDSVVSS